MADFLKVRSLITNKQVLKNHLYRQGYVNGQHALPSSTNCGDSVILITYGSTYDYDIENLLTLDDGDMIISSILQARGEGDIEVEIEGTIIGPPGGDIQVLDRNFKNYLEQRKYITVHSQGGFVDITGMDTEAAVVLPYPYPDADYGVTPGTMDITGDEAANRTVVVTNVTAAGFNLSLSAPPGMGKSLRVAWRSYRP